MNTYFLSEGKVDTSLGWLLWALLAFFVLMVLVGWWVSRKGQSQAVEKEHEGHSGEEEHVSAAKHGEAETDDLTILEGIGPKVAALLKEAGITTFAQLASSDPAHIEAILRQAKLQMLDPRGWIEQAHLAAQGDWEGLKKLQSELKGGRRV